MAHPDSRRPILLIVNPAAGGKPGSGGLSAEADDDGPRAMADLLRNRGLEVELHVLDPEDDLPALAADAARGGADVVVAGGDGTVGPVAGALLGSEATLGIVPLGSFNNLARGARLPLERDEALDRIAAGEVLRLDAGLAWRLPAIPAPGAPPPSPPGDATPFFEAAGVGIDAEGFGAARVGERRGPWFAARAAWRAMRRRQTPVRLALDGRDETVASPAITVCNGPYHGFGFALAPDADPADGVLDVVIFSRMSRFAVVRHFLGVARGRPRDEPRLELRRATTIVVSGQGARLPAHADGRAIGLTPVAMTVRPGVLRLFGPGPGAPES